MMVVDTIAAIATKIIFPQYLKKELPQGSSFYLYHFVPNLSFIKATKKPSIMKASL
jgi:hypothetical protein